MKHRPVIRSVRALATYLLASGEQEHGSDRGFAQRWWPVLVGGGAQIPGSMLSQKTIVRVCVWCLMMGFTFARLTCA